MFHFYSPKYRFRWFIVLVPLTGRGKSQSRESREEDIFIAQVRDDISFNWCDCWGKCREEFDLTNFLQISLRLEMETGPGSKCCASEAYSSLLFLNYSINSSCDTVWNVDSHYYFPDNWLVHSVLVNQVKTGREYWEGQSCHLTLMVREEVERWKSIRKSIYIYIYKQNLQDVPMNWI